MTPCFATACVYHVLTLTNVGESGSGGGGGVLLLLPSLVLLL